MNDQLLFVTVMTDYSRKPRKFTKVSDISFDDNAGLLFITLSNGIYFTFALKHIREYSVRTYDPEIAAKRKAARMVQVDEEVEETE